MTNISVVIPTCDRVKRLQRALRSVDRQNLPASVDMEVVVVNDGQVGSLSSLTSRYPVTLVETGGYVGPAAARNRGVEESAGEWIVFLDDDDVFTSHKIVRLYDLLPQHDVICNGAEIRLVKEKIRYYSGVYQGKQWFRQLLIKNIVGGTSRVSVRRRSFRKVGGFCTDMTALEDYELWIRMAKADMRFASIDEPLTIYESVTQTSSVSKNVEKYDKAATQICNIYEEDYALMTSSERTEHRQWVKSILAQKHLLNGQNREASKIYWHVYRNSGSIKYAVMAILSIVWPDGLFYARKWLARRW